MRYLLNILFAMSLIILLSETASAQLFGERQLGRNLNRRQRASMDTAGTVDSNRRFIRGQRRSGEVVGTNNAATQTFVGREQATPGGPVTSSVTGLREQQTRAVNQPRRVSRNGRYPERLIINFDSPLAKRTSSMVLSSNLRLAMEQRGIQIEVSEATHSAILRGVVSSAHDREIAELIVLFEPGIEKVENALTIE